MEKVRILWSGITGRTGVLAEKFAKDYDFVEIVAGLSRTNENYYSYDQLDDIKEEFDIIVDFSNAANIDILLDFAKKTNKPLIIGTAGLTQEQVDKIEETAKVVPIFRGGNFRFHCKKFIDDIVEFAKTTDQDLELVETHYKTKKIPSETAKEIARRVLEETGKTVKITSKLEYDELINDWRLGSFHFRVDSFEQLAKDVLKIAFMFKDKKAGFVWDLNKLLDEKYN